MKLIELTIYTSRQGIEPVTALLMEKKISGAVIHDPADVEDLLEHKEEYRWDYVDESVVEERDQEPTVVVYFDDTEEGRAQMQDLKLSIMMLKSKEMEGVFGWDAKLGRLYAEDKLVDDQEWKDNWKEYFKPTRITEHLTVKPTWETYAAAPGESVIELDPGMAFGTGTHETTSLCLQLMEKYMEPEQAVLDVGCGSGILSIGAFLLGSKDILAVDIDPEAIKVSKENVEKNKAGQAVRILEGDLAKGIDFKANLVVANLTADLIGVLAQDMEKHLKPGGIFISSGILTEKKETTLDAIKARGFHILETAERGEWCAIAAQV